MIAPRWLRVRRNPGILVRKNFLHYKRRWIADLNMPLKQTFEPLPEVHR